MESHVLGKVAAFDEDHLNAVKLLCLTVLWGSGPVLKLLWSRGYESLRTVSFVHLAIARM